MNAADESPRRENALFRMIAPAEASKTRLVVISALLLLWLVILTILYLRTGQGVREDQSLVHRTVPQARS